MRRLFLLFSDRRLIILLLLVVLVFFLTGFLIGTFSDKLKETDQDSNFLSNISQSKNPLPPPQISGWVAWWTGQKAYELINRYPGKITSVSPVWFMIDDNLKLKEVGAQKKKDILQTLKGLGIAVLPSLGSDLTGEKLSPLFQDEAKISELIEGLTAELVSLEADGLDIDLEGIKEEDKDRFSIFLSEFSASAKKHDLLLSVTIHAQTAKVEWEGVLGQDLQHIGEIADEVRIMAYDKHSASTGPGAIAPLSWIGDVAMYNSRFIDKQKIVMGIPSYGYIWTDAGTVRGLQFDEFQSEVAKQNYDQHRDKDSQELVITAKGYTGWLSDSSAMVKKIESLRALGLNRFIVWHLGGMDEMFFANDWSE